MTFQTSDNALAQNAPPRDDFWVFGYGSLMWRPGFEFVTMKPAYLPGYRRDMCIMSIHYRGTLAVPGLVCGLTPGDGCQGRAYRIHPDHVDAVVRYLDERELITKVYLPLHHDIELAGGKTVKARVYVADTAHEQYVGDWNAAQKTKCIVAGTGSEGRSLDYLANIVAHLQEIGINDLHMTDLLAEAAKLDRELLQRGA